MALPEFDDNGDLPPGVYTARLAEVEYRFGTGSAQRTRMFQRLNRIFEIVTRNRHLARLIVYGSFITAEPLPNDVDVFLIFDDEFDVAQADGELLLLLDHAAADANYGASVFWLRRPAVFGSEESIVQFWQTKRDGTLRGIVELSFRGLIQ
jgi:hypothetical protein